MGDAVCGARRFDTDLLVRRSGVYSVRGIIGMGCCLGAFHGALRSAVRSVPRWDVRRCGRRERRPHVYQQNGINVISAARIYSWKVTGFGREARGKGQIKVARAVGQRAGVGVFETSPPRVHQLRVFVC